MIGIYIFAGLYIAFCIMKHWWMLKCVLNDWRASRKVQKEV